MKLLLTVCLMLAVYWQYSAINASLNKGVEAPPNFHQLADYSSSLQKLDVVSKYDAITRFPLFNENREPSKVEVKTKIVKPQPVRQQFKVQALGIAVTGDGVLAVLKDLRNGKNMRLRIDDQIYGWTLKGVSEDSFTFIKGDARKVIEFKNDRRH